MAQPLPISIALYSEIVYDLNALDGLDPKSFIYMQKIKRIEEKAIELKRHDIAKGFAAFGGVAAAKREIQQMHQAYSNAMQYDSDIVIKSNYAVSMTKCNLNAEAFIYSKKLYETNEGNVPLLHVLAGSSFELGDEVNFLLYARQYKKLTRKDHDCWALYIKEINEIQSLNRACAAATARSCANAVC
jgi:hypothetical protein